MATDLSAIKKPTPRSIAKRDDKRAELMGIGLAKRRSIDTIKPRSESDYWQQYAAVSDQIRNSVRSLRTPSEIKYKETSGGYYIVEWRIRPSGPPEDRLIGGCGCGCGCGCGG